MLLRWLYNLGIHLIAPGALLLIAWRGRRNPAYRGRLAERLGYIDPGPARPVIWVHAVSLGEVQAATPLLRALQQRYPTHALLVTTATPTGAQRVQALAQAASGAGLRHCYFPYDLPSAVRRFLDRARPVLAVVLETEIWPNLFRECARRQIPVVVASARLSARSVRRLAWAAALFSDVLAPNVIIAAQSAGDAERFQRLGAAPARLRVTGNLKFDLQVAPSVREQGMRLRQEQFATRPVWVAGSTHEGEEDLVLTAHQQLCRQHPDALLILAPRHPNRFAEVGQRLTARGIEHVRRTTAAPVTVHTRVLLLDTLGELLSCYAAADLAFVGGSLVPVGGHSLLEPAALGLPILTGPHNFNAADVARLFLDSGAALQVNDAEQLYAALAKLLSAAEERARAGERALQLVASNRGTLERLLEIIASLVAAQPGGEAP
jgi:3-deoxy-D-manno-octulosonic-acid transferase